MEGVLILTVCVTRDGATWLTKAGNQYPAHRLITLIQRESPHRRVHAVLVCAACVKAGRLAKYLCGIHNHNTHDRHLLDYLFDNLDYTFETPMLAKSQTNGLRNPHTRITAIDYWNCAIHFSDQRLYSVGFTFC